MSLNPELPAVPKECEHPLMLTAEEEARDFLRAGRKAVYAIPHGPSLGTGGSFGAGVCEEHPWKLNTRAGVTQVVGGVLYPAASRRQPPARSSPSDPAARRGDNVCAKCEENAASVLAYRGKLERVLSKIGFAGRCVSGLVIQNAMMSANVISSVRVATAVFAACSVLAEPQTIQEVNADAPGLGLMRVEIPKAQA